MLPIIRPPIIFFSKQTINKIAGSSIIHPAALIAPHGIWYWFILGMEDIKRLITFTFLVVNIRGVKNSFRQVIKLMIHKVAMIGFSRGRIIRTNAPAIVAPSILAASSSEEGIWLIKPEYMMVENGIKMEKYNITNPPKVSLSPKWRHKVIRGMTVTVPGIIVENMIKANAAFNPFVWHLAKP